MSLPPPPKQLVGRSPNGETVCFDHGLRLCYSCCVDFSFDHHVHDEPDEEDDRVFILSESMARFMPQWDEQILGPGNTVGIPMDYANPPKPLGLSSFQVHECATCQLRWLIGNVGEDAAKSHPSHHTYAHEYAGTRRSLVVFVDGACPSNGLPAARAGLGVFFAKESEFNISEPLALSGPATNQKAELAAVARALETVRTKVLPARREFVTKAAGGHDPRSVKDTMRLRLVIITDSSYAVECMCSYFKGWKETENGVLVNIKSNKPVENSAGFMRIKREVEKLSMVGVQVVYYHVGREYNKEADKLARESLID